MVNRRKNQRSRGGGGGGGNNDEVDEGEGNNFDCIKEWNHCHIQALLIVTDHWISRTAPVLESVTT